MKDTAEVIGPHIYTYRNGLVREVREHGHKLDIVPSDAVFTHGHLIGTVLHEFPHRCPGDGCAIERWLRHHA